MAMVELDQMKFELQSYENTLHEVKSPNWLSALSALCPGSSLQYSRSCFLRSRCQNTCRPHRRCFQPQMETLTFEALYSAFQNVNHFKEC